MEQKNKSVVSNDAIIKALIAKLDELTELRTAYGEGIGKDGCKLAASTVPSHLTRVSSEILTVKAFINIFSTHTGNVWTDLKTDAVQQHVMDLCKTSRVPWHKLGRVYKTEYKNGKAIKYADMDANKFARTYDLRDSEVAANLKKRGLTVTDNGIVIEAKQG